MKTVVTVLITFTLIFALSCQKVNDYEETSQLRTETTLQATASYSQVTEALTDKGSETEAVKIESTEQVKTTAKISETSQNPTRTSQINSAAFRYDDGEEVYITAAEYKEICGVVMNEAGHGSYEGCVAVAQAIRNQIIREQELGHAYDIASVRKTYQEHYTKTPNEQVRQAVTDVFYNHIVVTTEPIIAWCAGYSEWHASQVQVCSFDGNDFYKLTKNDW